MARDKIDKSWFWLPAVLFAIAAIVKLIATIRWSNGSDQWADYLTSAALGAVAAVLAMRARRRD